MCEPARERKGMRETKRKNARKTRVGKQRRSEAGIFYLMEIESNAKYHDFRCRIRTNDEWAQIKWLCSLTEFSSFYFCFPLDQLRRQQWFLHFINSCKIISASNRSSSINDLFHKHFIPISRFHTDSELWRSFSPSEGMREQVHCLLHRHFFIGCDSFSAFVLSLFCHYFY